MAKRQERDLTSTQIALAVATYAAIISTLSLVLAIRVHHAGSPKVSVHWAYTQTDRKLTVTILNTGRADVTISAIELYVERDVIIRGSREAGQWDSRIETLSHIPNKLWLSKSNGLTLPSRLAANSMFSIQVKNKAITLPTQFPLDELLLKFVVRFPREITRPPRGIGVTPPGGKAVTYVGGDVLRHFVGVDPDRPISRPSPGSLPLDD
jgi:hypothetical protein